MKLYQIFIILLLSISIGFGQSKEKKIEGLIDDFVRTLESKPDSSLYYINSAIEESKNINDNFLLSRSLYNKGYFFYSNDKKDQAKPFFLKAIIPAKASSNFKILTISYNQLGLIEMEKGNYDESLKMFLASYKIANKNNLKQKEFDVLNNLGTLYSAQGDTLKAIENHEKSEKIAVKEGFKSDLFYVYNNIALLKKESHKQDAIDYFLKALQVSHSVNDKYNKFVIYINLSNIYLKMNDKKAYGKALFYLDKADKLIKEKDKQAFYLKFNFGGYYYKIKKYDKAIDFYNVALELTKINEIDNEQIIRLYGALADAYKANREFESALYYQEKFMEEKNKIFNIEKNKAFNEIQTKYEVEKKNLKIDILTKEKEIERERKKIILMIGVIVTVLLIVIAFWYKNKVKTQKIINEKEHKIHQQEVTRLEQEKELKKIVGIIEGQDKERNRLAKEIHDGIGGDLAGIKFKLTEINTVVQNETIQNVIHHLTKTFQELRKISHNLSSNYIQGKKLDNLLYDLKEQYENRAEFNLEIVVFPEQIISNLPKEVKHHLYRIIQELLNNVSKHAKANQVAINLTKYENTINIIVEDNGVGFETNNYKGIGLQNIEERLSSLNGDMNIESGKQGTTIVINIPI